MTVNPRSQQELVEEATAFAERLNRLVSEVLVGEQPPFRAPVTAESAPGSDIRRVQVTTQRQAPGEHLWLGAPLALEVKGDHESATVHVRASFSCNWDTQKRYLSVEKSQIEVLLMRTPMPLFRFEYDRKYHDSGALPAAHTQVHAHRDEVLYLMRLASQGRPRSAARQGGIPRLSELHMPVGGDRFRPCLEDILEFVITEFGAEKQQNWRDSIRRGRVEWRQTQLQAAVRDQPAAAADVLRVLGWHVEQRDESVSEPQTRRISRI